MWLHQGAFKQPEEAVVSKEAFIITLGKAMKGTVEEQGHIIVALSTDADTTKGIPRNGIRKVHTYSLVNGYMFSNVASSVHPFYIICCECVIKS